MKVRTTPEHPRTADGSALQHAKNLWRTLKGRSIASDAPQHRSDRILKSLTSKGLRGCPVCSQDRFSVGPERVLISTPEPSTAEGAPVETTAMVPVMCGNCGYTMLFSPGKLPEQGE